MAGIVDRRTGERNNRNDGAKEQTNSAPVVVVWVKWVTRIPILR